MVAKIVLASEWLVKFSKIIFHVDVLLSPCYDLSDILDEGFNAIIIYHRLFAVKLAFSRQ